MSVLQYVQALSVKRDHIPGFGFYDDLDTKENVEKVHQNLQKQWLSQKNIEVKIVNKNADHLKRRRAAHRILYYANHERTKEIKRQGARDYRKRNPQRAKELSANWRKKNIERVRELHRLAYRRFIENKTPEERKAWTREKNRKAKQTQIERAGGAEKYRMQENERIKNFYKNNPAAYEKNKEINRLRMRAKRAQLKQEKQP